MVLSTQRFRGMEGVNTEGHSQEFLMVAAMVWMSVPQRCRGCLIDEREREREGERRGERDHELSDCSS
jgi:hypothetical protein